MTPTPTPAPDAVRELADRLWRIHPRELQNKNVTRSAFYEAEIATFHAAHVAALKTRIAVLESALGILSEAALDGIIEASRRLNEPLGADVPAHPVAAYLSGLAICAGKAKAVVSARTLTGGGDDQS